MLDLSSNNGTGHDFHAAYVKGGQRRVYLKLVQGVGYVNPLYAPQRPSALHAGLKVGAYDYLEPLAATAADAASFLLDRLELPLVPGRDLRPALDCEWPKVTPGPEVGAWVAEVAAIVAKRVGAKPLIYGSGYWLEACRFKAAPGPLWLAAYGRDDGREYPVGRLPKPWATLAAHQFTDKARVVGIVGDCDLSHVYVAAGVDLPAKRV